MRTRARAFSLVIKDLDTLRSPHGPCPPLNPQVSRSPSTTQWPWATSSTSLALVSAASARCDWCMTPGELAAVRRRLEEFAAEMFASLARRDQRDKGATYGGGVLLVGRGKTVQPEARRVGGESLGGQ